MDISMIVAHSKNRAIGRDGELPWHLPDDLRWFKNKTINHVIIMGRKTWDTFNGRPLPKRHHVVLSRSKDVQLPEGVHLVNTMQEALAKAKSLGEKEVFITGGQQIYEMFLPVANKLYVTEINCDVEGADAFFPDFIDKNWKSNFKTFHPIDDKHEHSFTFNIYDRID